MKAVVAVFNQEKALVGAFSVIVKTGCGTDGSICGTTPDNLLSIGMIVMEHQTQIDVTRLTRRHSLAVVSDQSSIYYSGPLSIWLLLAACSIHGKYDQKLEWRAKNGRNSSTTGHGANYEKFKWESGSRLAILAILLGVDTANTHWFVSTRVFCISGGYSDFWQCGEKRLS